MEKPEVWEHSVVWAYLLDDMLPPDKEQFETLLAQSPELQLEVAKEKLLMELLGNLPPADDLAHDVAPPVVAAEEATRYTLKQLLRDAFLVCLLVTMVYLLIAYFFS
jgi:hypothetical protein